MKTDARTKIKEDQDTTHTLWGKIKQRFPHRVTFIIGNFRDNQPSELGKAIDTIKKKNKVIIIQSEEEVKIKKVWI